MAMKKSQKSLKKWSDQKWRTRSGKPSIQGPNATGERYMPASAVKALTPEEHASTTRAKRKAIRKGKQYAKNTPKAKKKITRARKKTPKKRKKS